MTTNIELDTRSSIRWLWRQLTSMRTALILLLLLGIAAIPGSLFPQRTQNPLAVSDYFKSNPGTAKFLDQLQAVTSAPLLKASIASIASSRVSTAATVIPSGMCPITSTQLP